MCCGHCFLNSLKFWHKKLCKFKQKFNILRNLQFMNHNLWIFNQPVCFPKILDFHEAFGICMRVFFHLFFSEMCCILWFLWHLKQYIHCCTYMFVFSKCLWGVWTYGYIICCTIIDLFPFLLMYILLLLSHPVRSWRLINNVDSNDVCEKCWLTVMINLNNKCYFRCETALDDWYRGLSASTLIQPLSAPGLLYRAIKRRQRTKH